MTVDVLDQEAKIGPVATRDEVIARLGAEAAALRRLGATGLYLFGSAARDELVDDSDVDLFFDYDDKVELTLIDILRMQHHLGRVLQREVDFMTRDSLHPRLRSEIEASSVRVM